VLRDEDVWDMVVFVNFIYVLLFECVVFDVIVEVGYVDVVWLFIEG